MKRYILLVVMLLAGVYTAGAQTTKVSDKISVTGNAYTMTKTASGASDIQTSYTWFDQKENISYDIYLHKYTKGDNAGKYIAFIYKTSKKTGNQYKYYLPDGMAVAEDIIKRNPNLVK